MTTTDLPPNALARSERDALCDLMVEEGPDAPTLCGDWTTKDLAAHLVIRERRADAAIGIVVRPFAGWTDRVQQQVSRRPWPDLVDDVRTGPPRWAPQSIASLDAEINTIEFFVHHEDVRRAAPVWEPRALDEAANADLWGRWVRASRLLMRRCPVGIVAEPTDGPAAGTSLTLREGDSSVRLAGPVGEIVLAGFGRVTRGLDIIGADADVEAFLDFPR